MKLRKAFWGLLPLVLVACSSEQSPEKASSLTAVPASLMATAPIQRWYEPRQVDTGARVFQQNCAVCHGKQGEGAPAWRESGPDGTYPPPPLNGTGHAWHHPLRMLYQVVKNGSPGGQGNMPAWGEKLNDEEIVAVIAWFQSQWPEQIYDAWQMRELASRAE